MISIAVLASGSSGNSIYLESDGAKVLIDAGLSTRAMAERLRKVGRSLDEVDAIFLSHEHSDHVRGLGSLSRNLAIPIYTNLDLLATVVTNPDKVRRFEAGEPFSFNDLTITPFPVPHDCRDPVGFVIENGGAKVGVVTDLGSVTRLVIERLKGSNLIIIETNHDEEMLNNGRYPWFLKQRVAGRDGHLSNREAGKALSQLLHPGLGHVFLAHLSRENNLPSLAYSTVSEYLDGAKVDLHLTFAERPSDLVSLEEGKIPKTKSQKQNPKP